MKNLILISIITFLMIACSESDADKETIDNTLGKSMLSFITLNNKMDASMVPIEYLNYEMTQRLEMGVEALKSINASPETITNAEKHLRSMEEVNKLTKDVCNYLIEENYELLIESIGKSDLNSIEDDYGLIKWLIEDERGYKHLHDLTYFTNKDDIVAPNKYFVESIKGKELLKKIHTYRDELCKSIANYSEGRYEYIRNYSLNPSGIPRPKFLSTKEDRKNFIYEVEKYIETQNVNKDDKHVIRDVIVRLTMPKKIMINGKGYYWLKGLFGGASVVSTSAILTSIRADMIGVETLAGKLISSRLNAPMFSFNKIEPLAFASSSYINQGDSIGLKVMMAAYDSNEAMKLVFWEDDTTQISLPRSQRDESLMNVFNGKPGDELMFSGFPGDHIITGEIAVKERGVEKWKPWSFHYSVGSPSAGVKAADLQVLYKGWDNKVQVSASGYNPEKVSVSCSGCNISYKPDRNGNYTVKVTKGKEAFISVSAVDENGKRVELAKQSFRIFNLPNPTPFFGGKSGGTLKKVDAVSIPKLFAKLGESPLDVSYEVVEFSLYITLNGSPVRLKAKGNRITNEMKNAIKKIPKGGNLTFAEIKVKGPEGKISSLESGLVFRLN